MADEIINVGARDAKVAGKVFLKTIFGGVLAIIVYFSMTMIFTGLGTHTIGEQVYQYDENSNPVLVETRYFDEESGAASQEAGAAVSDSSSEESEDGKFTVSIRSEMDPIARFFYQLLTGLCMVLLLLSMPYSDLWTLGDKDNNNVTFGRLAEDKLRGLKIGLLAGIPGFVCYILLILSRFGVITGGFLRIYEWLNAPYILLIQGMTGNAGSTAEMAGWCLLPIALLTLLVPATCALGYYLGYREFSLSEKFLYSSGKKKRRRR